MTRASGILIGDGGVGGLGGTRARRARGRTAAAEPLLIEIRWLVAAAALGSSTGGVCDAADRELIASLELARSGTGTVVGRLSVGWAGGHAARPGATPEPRMPEPRSLSGRLVEVREGWMGVRLSDGDGLRLEFLVRRPHRRRRTATSLGTPRIAYLRTNLLDALGLAGGRYSEPATRVTTISSR
jgi:hypothetical protein